MRKSFDETLAGFDGLLRIPAVWDLITRATPREHRVAWTYPTAKFALGKMSSRRLQEIHMELNALRLRYLGIQDFAPA